MEIKDESPVVLRRRLRIALRSLREGRQLSQREVATALDWAQSKLMRIEVGATGISVIDLRALLTYYGVTDADRVNELIQTARYARRQLYGEYSNIFSSPLLTYLQYEGAASAIHSFETVVIPGLLQTEEYATALMRLRPIPTDTEEALTQRVQARLERQRVLTRADSPKTSFILDEAALHRHVAGRTGMVRQLQKLLEVGELSNVEIRIIPFERGEHLGLWGSLMILEFAAPEDDALVYLEYQLGDQLVDGDMGQVAPYIEKFMSLEACSSPTEESRRIIERIIERLT